MVTMAVMPMASTTMGTRFFSRAGGMAGWAPRRQRANADFMGVITWGNFRWEAGRGSGREDYRGNLMSSSTAPITLLRTCINMEKDRLASWLAIMAPTRSSLRPASTSAIFALAAWSAAFTPETAFCIACAKEPAESPAGECMPPNWAAGAIWVCWARSAAALVSDARSAWIMLAMGFAICVLTFLQR